MPLYRVPIIAFVALVLVSAATFLLLKSPRARLVSGIRRFWGLYALSQVLLIALVFGNHLSFPLNLEFMESAVLQHVARLSAGLPLYIEPSPEFVPLAYNPLFYLVGVPFVRIFGENMMAIRLPAVLGSLGTAVMVFVLVRGRTRSRWWAGIGIGLFAAAYRVMDCYLDVGHRDSLLIFSILMGLWCLDRGGRWQPYLGMVCLAMGFWFKQQGILFLFMGIAYAFWRYPVRAAAPVSLLGVALGPLLYWCAPASWWGPRFHFYTYEVPTQWTAFQWSEIAYLARLLLWHYGALVAAAIWLWGATLLRRAGPSLGIWRLAVPGALLSGLAATMTPGSSNNVFIPMGVLIITGGVIALARMSRLNDRGRRFCYALLGLAFASLLYRPQTVLTPPGAEAAFGDFAGIMLALDGPVFGPGLGRMVTPPGSQVRQAPTVHVMPMSDMVRGPGRDENAHPAVRALLQSVENPVGMAYIMGHSTLTGEPTLAYLDPRYRLLTDFEKRFEALATLPARHGHLYPQYLYQSIQSPPGGRRAAQPTCGSRPGCQQRCSRLAPKARTTC